MKGFIYILTNPAMPGLVKIGLAESVEKRLKSLYTSGVPVPFIEEYSAFVLDMESVESQIHQHLDSYRTNSKREFFSISLEKAIHEVSSIIEAINQESDDEFIDNFYSIWNCPFDDSVLKFD